MEVCRMSEAGKYKNNLSIVGQIIDNGDGVDAQTLAKAKDVIAEAFHELHKISPKKNCASCLHFRMTDCELRPGEMPPKEILENGCSKWVDVTEIPF